MNDANSTFMLGVVSTEEISAEERCHQIDGIRDLNPDEIEEYVKYRESFEGLRSKAALIGVVNQNFKTLTEYFVFLQNTKGPPTSPVVELNRHLMNYIYSAYALREHAQTDIKRVYGRNSDEVIFFKSELGKLEQQCFAYAFFQDFRNFVQHCGFPVGGATRTDTPSGNILEVIFKKSALLERYGEWKKSNLSSYESDIIDLIELSNQHHEAIKGHLFRIIMFLFGKDIEEVERCMAALHAEATKGKPSSEAVVITNVEAGTITFESISRSPLSDVGLRRAPNSNDQSN